MRRRTLGVRIRVVALAAVVGLLFVTPASAALVEQDLSIGGDGLLTLDDQTGLQWLDVDQTLGVSPVDILADVGGWISLGFRYASGAEVCGLAAAYGLDPLCSGSPLAGTTVDNSTSPPTANDLLISLLSVTTVAGSQTRTQGVYDSGSLYGDALLLKNTSPVQTVTAINADNVLATDPLPLTIGNYLVRASAPEPSTALLVGLALAALGAMRRRAA